MSDVIHINAPHFDAGLIHKGGVVVKAAPIIKYMVGWTGKQVADYCKRKGWTWSKQP